MFWWNAGLTVMAVLFVTFSSTKLIAIANAIRWMCRYGLKYTELIKEYEHNNPGTAIQETHIYDICHETNANFWPFGLKDHRLRQWAQNNKPKNKLRKLIFTYPYLIVEMSTLVVVGVSLAAQFDLRSWITILWLGTICCAMALINIAMVVEFLLGSIIMEKYVRYFHVLDDIKFFAKWHGRISDNNLDLLRGIYMLLALLGGVFLFGFAAVYFGILIPEPGSFVIGNCSCQKLNVLSCLAEQKIEHWFIWSANIAAITSYYVTTTLSTVGYGDIYPVDIWGYCVAMSLQIQQVTLFVFAASIFLATFPK